MAVLKYKLKPDRTDLVISSYGRFRVRPNEVIELDLAIQAQADSVTIGDYDVEGGPVIAQKPHNNPIE